MGRVKRLLALASFVSVSTGLGSLGLVGAAFACSGGDYNTTTCTQAQTADDGVTITATQDIPGSTGNTASKKTTPRRTTPTSRSKPPLKLSGQILDTVPIGRNVNPMCSTMSNCNLASLEKTKAKSKRKKPSTGAITIRDIATFHPAPGRTEVEPNGWSVIGLETNPFSSAAPVIVTGTLRGQSAEVRFSPISWRWNYGDGATRDSSTSGASWRALAAREFSRTSTSHSYGEPGTYTITPTMTFSAEYRFASDGWTPVAGIVHATGQAVTVVVGTASTVLVSADCASASAAPGCASRSPG